MNGISFCKSPINESWIAWHFQKVWRKIEFFIYSVNHNGKHIRIQKPKNDGFFYYNYKHTHSIILMAVTGPEYECLYTDVGPNGRLNDSGTYYKGFKMDQLSSLITKICLTVKLPTIIFLGWCFCTKMFYDETFSSARFDWAGHVLELYWVQTSNTVLFCENHAKVYFDAKYLERGLNRGSKFFVLFRRKVPFS